MKWLLIVAAYVACSDPVLTNTGREFDTQDACVSWAKSNMSQLQISSDMQIQCVPKHYARPVAP
jgi:hypothetical protein